MQHSTNINLFTSSFSTASFVTTSSFNSFTASYNTDSASFSSSIAAIQQLSASTAVTDIVYNGEATTIVKGTPLYVSGAQGANPIVYRADAANPNKMPVTYIANGNITSGNLNVGHKSTTGITNSSIVDTGTLVTIDNNTTISGSLIVTVAVPASKLERIRFLPLRVDTFITILVISEISEA